MAMARIQKKKPIMMMSAAPRLSRVTRSLTTVTRATFPKVEKMVWRSELVAKIVADAMHNQLLFEHLLQVHLVPPERIHPKLWKGTKRRFKPFNWVEIERKRHNKERTLEEQKKLVEGIMKRELKRKKRIEAAGIDYECPKIAGSDRPASKKIKFDDE